VSGERNGPLRVLLVEDSPSDAELLQVSLAEAGPECHAVVCAGTLAEAVALACQQPLDAILLDLTLPDTTGLETVVRARAAWPEVPIVVLTGANDEAMGFAAVRNGVQDFLVKGQAGGALIARALRYAIERQRSETEIRRMNRELEQRVVERTAQLRRLALEFTLVEQRERRRLAELLHDNLQQLLVFSHLSVGKARSRVTEAELARNLERVERTLAEAIEVARSLTAELSPPALYTHGLAAAVRWYAGRLRAMAGLAVAVHADDGAEPELESQRALLFQSVRELLLNVVKHAGVGQAAVRIDRGDQGGIRIAVSDEGQGFTTTSEDCGEVSGGFGLLGVRERLRQMGGRCEVQSVPGRGTMVTLSVPDRPSAA
jgi:signal transduction histidine kinase